MAVLLSRILNARPQTSLPDSLTGSTYPVGLRSSQTFSKTILLQDARGPVRRVTRKGQQSQLNNGLWYVRRGCSPTCCSLSPLPGQYLCTSGFVLTFECLRAALPVEMWTEIIGQVLFRWEDQGKLTNDILAQLIQVRPKS